MLHSTQTDLEFIARVHFCRCCTVDTSHLWVRQPFSILAMTVSGRIDIVFESSDAAKLEPALNQVFYLPVGLRHRPVLVSPVPAEVVVLGFLVEVIPGLDALRHVPIPLLPVPNEPLQAHLRELEDCEADPDDQSLQRLAKRQAIVQTLVAELLADAPPTTFSLTRDEQRCLPALRFLNENAGQPLDVDGLAELCNMSRTHFFRVFRKQMNCTPFDYLRALRVQRARQLLAQTDLTVAEIGAAVGWSDPFHFSRMFKAATGMPPTQYRANWRERRLV